MTKCPQCSSTITMAKIATAACPVWISCSSCGARLVGTKFVKVQTLVIFAVAALTSALITWAYITNVLSRTELWVSLVVAVIAIAVPNVLVTYRYGSYSVRSP